MKTTATLLTLLALFSPNTPAQDYSQLNLPEGAVARLGKGKLAEIQYSPDGTLLAVASTIGIWLTIQRRIEQLPYSPDIRIGC